MAFFGHKHTPYFRKRKVHPLFISLLIIAGGVALFYLIQFLFFGQTGEVAEVKLNVPPQNTVYVQFSGEETYRSVMASSIKLLENEVVQSRNTANSSLEFFEKSELYLDTKTEIRLVKSRVQSGDTREIRVRMNGGKIWADVALSLNPRSVFEIQLSSTIFITSKNGEFSVDYDKSLVKVAKGNVRISKQEKGTEVFSQDVGVGQQFEFSDNIEEKALAILTEDDWFSAHAPREVPPASEEVSSEESGDKTLGEENPVKILVPGKNNSVVLISKEPQKISGTVPRGTKKVVINDYALSKFVEGDKEFTYIASVKFESLILGKNVYVIQAFDKNDTLLGKAEITIHYDPEGKFEGGDTLGGEKELDATKTPESTGKLEITEPNKGDDFTAKDLTGFDLIGTTSSDTEKILVNDYALSKYVPGNEKWTYKVRIEFGNLKAGEENIYEVKAVDKNGKVLAKDFIKVIFPAKTGSEANVITPEAARQ
ncbi:FecR domain-containing protein [Candidatus Peregrinibacteria bacterium]|nr:FecR domain-containing protein [Candidatus Peregrinibacteria bacterium]